MSYQKKNCDIGILTCVIYSQGGDGAVDKTHAFGVRVPGLNPL